MDAGGLPTGFTLIRGGPTHRMLDRLGIAPKGFRGAIRLALILTGITFLPLVWLALMEGNLTESPGGMALAGDLAVMGRFLIALPVLVLVAPDCDHLSRRAVAHMADSGLIAPGRQQAFHQALRRVMWWRDRVWPEAFLLVLAFLPQLVLHRGENAAINPIPGWHHDASGAATLAGLWLGWVARPLYLFVALLWLWRFMLWGLLIGKFVRLGPLVSAAHPDGVAGLGFLIAVQQRFARFSFPGGVILAGAAANEILWRGGTLEGTGWLLAAYVVCSVVMISLPVIPLIPLLVRVKRAGLFSYGALGTTCVQGFQAEWLADPAKADESRKKFRALGADYALLTDLNGTFSVVRNLPILPFDRSFIIWVTLPAALPMLPVLLMAADLPDLLRELAGILL